MSIPDPTLIDLARASGVATEFTDWRGHTQTVSTETLHAVLTALGIDASDPAARLADRELAPWRRTLPPVIVATEGEWRWFPVHVHDGERVSVHVELEAGGVRPLRQMDHWIAPREIDGQLVGEATFEVPNDLPLGYHTVSASSGGVRATAHLIVAPKWVGLPRRSGEGRSFGLQAQLYSVRSAGSWGIGDLTDLTDLAVWAGADLGASFVLINPLHAAEPAAPMEPSPYLPSSRRFFNPIYLRVEAVPEFAALPRSARSTVNALLKGLRAGDAHRIDRDAAWTAKHEALRLVHRVPRTAGRELDFRAFVAREGEALTDFATWSALALEFGADAREWPSVFRDPAAAGVAAWAEEHAAEVEFQRWLQWLLDEQLAHAQERAENAGLSLGIVHDLAVGVHPGGADAWRLADLYAQGVGVGAPPDPFNQQGQGWGQPPWRPDRLADAAYAPFRDLIRTVLRHAGGVRVDHVIGLFRLWWVPEGRPASEGAYVYYDHEALIAVLALEAVRADAVVIGEDLGVVDPSARATFAGRGILGTSILWFEREGDRARPAEQWREWCLATVNTHDLPPAAGYLAGDHVRLQHELGLLPGELDAALAADAGEQRAWLDELRSRGLLPDDADTEATVLALYRYLTRTPARLIGVSLTDAVGDTRTQNQPGTINEYPNWRVPLSGPDGTPILLEDVFTSARAAALAAAVRLG